MKCDDDTFVRVDAVLREAKKTPTDRSLYIGNINYYHKPLRQGKWAVTYEVINNTKKEKEDEFCTIRKTFLHNLFKWFSRNGQRKTIHLMPMDLATYYQQTSLVSSLKSLSNTN